jgi:hypothetical protein
MARMKSDTAVMVAARALFGAGIPRRWCWNGILAVSLLSVLWGESGRDEKAHLPAGETGASFEPRGASELAVVVQAGQGFPANTIPE